MSEKFDTTNWHTEKIINLEDAFKIANALHAQAKTVVSLNGSFDILHAGHLDMLEEAKRQGDILFVGINSDRSVQQGKGKDKPYMTAEARAALLAALACTDYVLIIDASYNGGVPKTLIKTIRPTVHTNGADYGEPETWVEWPTMRKYGTKGCVVQHRNRLSTSDLVKKILNAHLTR